MFSDSPPDRDALLAALDKAATVWPRFALLVLNLVGFRDINIEFGHAVGDRVLAWVAQRIRSVLRANDALFHVGADEFAIILGDLKSPQLVELAARKMLELVHDRIELQGTEIVLGARVGAALFPDRAATSSELMRHADAAQQKARKGMQGFAVYEPLTDGGSLLSPTLKGKLKSALDKGELALYYQPQVDLRRGIVAGCEALVRWHDAERGWISPELFVPVAETSDLVETLTYWSINVALREWFGQCGSCCPGGSVSVNLSARLLQSPDIVELVRRAMSIWGVTRRALVLEVTESAMLADSRAARSTLLALADLGVTLAIDDFGTGYSSLEYLKNLPVSELKIDKGFVLSMLERVADRKIVQSAIDLAHSLDMRVVAEGIENQQTLEMLVAMGCDIGQGYYISEPIPIDKLPSWARSEGQPWTCAATPPRRGSP
ncbi:MAG: bifunctional diguanylate cyclase/phosphodiesterase [Thiogranum sp.]